MAELSSNVTKIVRFLVIALIAGRGLYSCFFVPPVAPPALLAPVAVTAAEATATLENSVHQRLVKVDPVLLNEGRFSLQLFDETTYIALIDQRNDQRDGSFTWIGHLEGKRGSQVMVTVQNQMIHGSIQLDQKSYTLEHLHDDVYALAEVL